MLSWLRSSSLSLLLRPFSSELDAHRPQFAIARGSRLLESFLIHSLVRIDDKANTACISLYWIVLTPKYWVRLHRVLQLEARGKYIGEVVGLSLLVASEPRRGTVGHGQRAGYRETSYTSETGGE